jgi:lipoprotein NlpD
MADSMAVNKLNAMRMQKIRFIFFAASAVLIAACSTTRNAAPVVEHAPIVRPTVVAKAASRPADSRGTYTVKKGDTLYRIALDHGQSYRDIVAWNNLVNQNDIKVDQVLRVLPPENGNQVSTVQTGSVNTGSGVEVRQLAASPNGTGTIKNGTRTSTTGAKSSPVGEKRPYSDSTLAELQKPDVVHVSATSAATVKAEPAKTVEVKMAEKPADSSVSPTLAPDEEAVTWVWPADGKIIASFDEGKNRGIDIAGKSGQQILAAGAGKVMYAGSGIRGYGNLVIVKHTNSLLSAYAHNKAILVKEGQTVNKGQKIAEMGNSDTDAVKLHFEIRRQGKPVDPSKFLPNR